MNRFLYNSKWPLALLAVLALAVSGCLKEDDSPALSLSQSVVLIDWKAVSVPVEVNTNAEWKAASDQTWCRLSKSNGNASQTVNIIVDRNELAVTRTAVVTFRTTGDSKEVHRTIVVSQSGEDIWSN